MLLEIAGNNTRAGKQIGHVQLLFACAGADLVNAPTDEGKQGALVAQICN